MQSLEKTKDLFMELRFDAATVVGNGNSQFSVWRLLLF